MAARLLDSDEQEIEYEQTELITQELTFPLDGSASVEIHVRDAKGRNRFDDVLARRQIAIIIELRSKGVAAIEDRLANLIEVA